MVQVGVVVLISFAWCRRLYVLSLPRSRQRSKVQPVAREICDHRLQQSAWWQADIIIILDKGPIRV